MAKMLTAEQAQNLFNYTIPWQRPAECSAECAIRLITEKATEIAELKAKIEQLTAVHEAELDAVIALKAKIARLKHEQSP